MGHGGRVGVRSGGALEERAEGAPEAEKGQGTRYPKSKVKQVHEQARCRSGCLISHFYKQVSGFKSTAGACTPSPTRTCC